MPISDFNDTEMWVVQSTVNQRYDKAVRLELADAELRLDPSQVELTPCPTVYWTERGAHFVVSKVSEHDYRPQFFYSAHEQFGTGRERYDDLAECVTTLLQVQADHERTRALEEPRP